MGAWTKLIGVNRVLRAGGENPVSTLASTSGDALMAEAILDEVNFEQQAVGLTCNTEEVEYEPDMDGHITVPEATLHVQPLETDKLIVQRGRDPTTLYNLTDNTDVFTDTLKVRLTTGLDYEDLPFLQQVAIADEAGRRYEQLVSNDPAAQALLREVWLQSRARARADDIRSRAASIFGAWTSRLPYRAAKRTQRGFWR